MGEGKNTVTMEGMRRREQKQLHGELKYTRTHRTINTLATTGKTWTLAAQDTLMILLPPA